MHFRLLRTDPPVRAIRSDHKEYTNVVTKSSIRGYLLVTHFAEAVPRL